MKKLIIGLLAVAGALTILGLLALPGQARLATKRDHEPRLADLQYVLHWGELAGAASIAEIKCAWASERNWLVGDQTKVYVMKLNLENPRAFESWRTGDLWQRGPEADSVYRTIRAT